MIEQNIVAVLDTVGNLCPESFFQDIVGPVKVFQIQMPRIPLAHSLRLQDKTFTLGIHDIEHGVPVVEPIRQRPVKRIIHVFDIKHGNLPSVFFHRTLDRISPRAHIIYIRLGDRQSVNILS